MAMAPEAVDPSYSRTARTPRIGTLASLALLGLTAATASGCATVRSGAADIILPPDDEVALGKQMSAEVEQELKLLTDREVVGYVQQLGQQIVRATRNKRPEIQFTFKVVDDPEQVNAFALPGGWIYVYSGLLLEAENEAELMGVLGHEVAHVTARHIAERLATMYGLQVLSAIALGENPGQLAQIVAGLVANGYLLKYSRDQETQADAWGITYEINAGWDPHGVVTFFQKLAEAGGGVPRWLSSHPLPEDRVEHARALIEEKRPVPDKLGRERFQEIQARLRSGTRTPR